MTFRRPLRHWWTFPLRLSIAVVALWALWPRLLPTLILALAMFVVARRSVRALSRKIVVDRDGIRWKDVDVPWEDVDRLDFSPAYPDPHIAVLRKGEERPHALPFITPALYRSLRDRLNPLPPAVERKVLGDAWE